MNYSKVYKSCSLFGSLRYFSNIQDSVHLINGPSGCSFFNCSSVFKRNNIKVRKNVPKIFSTNFNENDVVFGGRKKLEDSISEIVAKYSPKAIFLYNCCVSEIIGEDIDEVSDIHSKIHGIKVIPVHVAGFKGDHKFGMIEASNILIDNFFEDVKCNQYKANTINVIGEFDINNTNVAELKDIFIDAGISVKTIFPGNSTIEDIEALPNAALNYVICGNAALNLAKKLNNRYNTDYILDKQLFMGIDNCHERLLEVYKKFEIEGVPHQLQYDFACTQMINYKEKLKNRTAVIVAGTSKALGFSEILFSLGVEVKMIFSEDMPNAVGVQDFRKIALEAYCDEEAEELADKIRSLKPDYLITTLTDIILPEPFIVINEEVSYSGFKGAVKFAKYLVELDSNARFRFMKNLK